MDNTLNNYYHYDTMFDPPLQIGDHNLVQIGRIFCKEGQGFGDHLHINWFELTVITQGKGTVYTNGVPTSVKVGDIYLSFPSDIHRIISSIENSLQYYYVSFYTSNANFKTELEEIVDKFHDAQSRLFSDNKIKESIENGIFEFYSNQQLFSTEIIKSVLDQIIVYLIRDFKEKKPEKKSINIDKYDMLCYQIMNYIDYHTIELESLSDLSDIFNYNYSYLSHIFKVHTNQTLQNYFIKSKLTKAQQLLTEKKLSVSKIAETLNFSSVYVFSKLYKKQFGFAPTKHKLS